MPQRHSKENVDLKGNQFITKRIKDYTQNNALDKYDTDDIKVSVQICTNRLP